MAGHLGGFWQPHGPLYTRTSPALEKRLKKYREQEQRRVRREETKKLRSELKARKFDDAILMDFYTKGAA